MQKIILLVTLGGMLFLTGFSQPTAFITSSEKKYNEVKDLFIQKQYALAYPLLKDLKQMYPESQASNHAYISEDINYYYTVCGLQLQQGTAVEDAKKFVSTSNASPRKDQMYYYLGKYYFVQNDFENTVGSYEKAGADNLNAEEIAEMKFEMGYSYFNLKRFDKAAPLFDEIHQLENNKYYIPANYYHGFISYYNKKYTDALASFKLVEAQDDYKAVVPYYIAEILYFQKNKEEALMYGETALRNGGLYYDKEMKQLVGQIYFEKKEFAKALPLFEYYYNNSNKVTKENLYQLSYCYYQGGKLPDAIKGFKQLSNEKDSLGQNSMYLLADCYLKTGEKENARSAFQFCATNSSNKLQQEISLFNYAKLSYELGYQDIALKELQKFSGTYKNSAYAIEAKEILVSLLAKTNNFSEALTLYNSFEKITPSMQKVYPKILFGRAMEYISEQQFSAADELLSKCIDLPVNSVTPFAHFWKGELNLKTGKYDEAIRNYTYYLQANVSNQGEVNQAAANYALGYCWLKKDNYKQALSYFEKVANVISVGSNSIQQDAYVRSADCYFMLKDFAKANSMYDMLINSASVYSDYSVYQKAMIAGVKSTSDKINILSSLNKNYPASVLVPEANLEIANTYMSDENFRAAIPYLNNILLNKNNFSLHPAAYLKLGLCYYNMNNNKEALANYTLLLEKYASSPEADEVIESIKNIYIEENRPNEFVELMRKNGKSIDVSEADALTYSAAELKYNNNDCTGAINGFSNYLQQFPTGAYTLQANYFNGECFSKIKDWNKAIVSYNAVLAKGVNKYYEKSALSLSRINYFELKDYPAAKRSFEILRSATTNADNQLEALRGLVRCYYQLKEYNQANEIAKDLLNKKGINNDDKAIAHLVLGKSLQASMLYDQAIASFKSCAALNKAAWGAEARYELAACYFNQNSLFNCEKAALSVIKETGSYDYWVTRSYILLGDIYFAKKDYFNAKATYLSVAQNAVIVELKNEAQQKADKTIAVESANSKIN
jgi:tetratricopeptide (TPR) repeat protein